MPLHGIYDSTYGSFLAAPCCTHSPGPADPEKMDGRRYALSTTGGDRSGILAEEKGFECTEDFDICRFFVRVPVVRNCSGISFAV